jgi:hypothetical protein
MVISKQHRHLALNVLHNSVVPFIRADITAGNSNQNVSAVRSQYATTEELLESQHITKELQ